MPINQELLFKALNEIINQPEKLVGGEKMNEKQKAYYTKVYDQILQLYNTVSNPENDAEIIPVFTGQCSQLIDKEGVPKKFYNVSDPVIQNILKESLKWDKKQKKYVMEHTYITDSKTGQKGVCLSMSEMKDAHKYSTNKKVRRKIKAKVKNLGTTLKSYHDYIKDAEHILSAVRVPEGNESNAYVGESGSPIEVDHPSAGVQLSSGSGKYPDKVSLDQCAASVTAEQCYVKQNWKGDQACMWMPHLRHLAPDLNDEAKKAWEDLKTSACVDIRTVPFPSRPATPTDERAANSNQKLAGDKELNDPYRILQSSKNPNGYVLSDKDFENLKQNEVINKYIHPPKEIKKFYEEKYETFSKTANGLYPQGVRIPVFFDNAMDSTYKYGTKEWDGSALIKGEYGRRQADAAVSIQRIFRKKKMTNVVLPKKAKQKIDAQYQKHSEAFETYKQILLKTLKEKNAKQESNKIKEDDIPAKFERLLKKKREKLPGTDLMVWEHEILSDTIDLDFGSSPLQGGDKVKGELTNLKKTFVALENISLYTTYQLAQKFSENFTEQDLATLLLADQRDSKRPMLLTNDDDCDAALIQLGLDYKKRQGTRKPIYTTDEDPTKTTREVIKAKGSFKDFISNVNSSEEMLEAIEMYKTGQRPIEEVFDEPMSAFDMPPKMLKKSYAVLWAGGAADEYDEFGKLLEGGALMDTYIIQIANRKGKKLSKAEFITELQKLYKKNNKTMTTDDKKLKKAYDDYDDIFVAVEAKQEPAKQETSTSSSDGASSGKFKGLLERKTGFKEGSGGKCHYVVGPYQLMVLKGAAKGGQLQAALTMIKKTYGSKGFESDDGAKTPPKNEIKKEVLQSITADEETLLEMMLRPDKAANDGEDPKDTKTSSLFSKYKTLRIAVREIAFNYPLHKWIRYHAKDENKLTAEQKTANGKMMDAITLGKAVYEKTLNEDKEEWKKFAISAYPSILYEFHAADDNAFVRMVKEKKGWGIWASDLEKINKEKQEIHDLLERTAATANVDNSLTNQLTALTAAWWNSPVNQAYDVWKNAKKILEKGGLAEEAINALQGDFTNWNTKAMEEQRKKDRAAAKEREEELRKQIENLEFYTNKYKKAREKVAKGPFKDLVTGKDFTFAQGDKVPVVSNPLERCVGTRAVEMLTRLQLFAPGQFEYHVDQTKGIVIPVLKSKNLQEQIGYEKDQWTTFFKDNVGKSIVTNEIDLKDIRQAIEKPENVLNETLKRMVNWIVANRGKLSTYLQSKEKAMMGFTTWRNELGAPKGIANKGK